MSADMSKQPIARTCVPDISCVSEAAKIAWRPELHDRSLRDAMFANPAMQDPIWNDLLQFHGIDADLAFSDDDASRRLEKMIDFGPERVALRCGLAVHGAQLAHLIATDGLQVVKADWPLEDVRAALQLRRLTSVNMSEASDLRHAVAESGSACLSSWLNALPTGIAAVLRICEGPLGAAYREGQGDPVLAEVCDVCLDTFEADVK